MNASRHRLALVLVCAAAIGGACSSKEDRPPVTVQQSPPSAQPAASPPATASPAPQSPAASPSGTPAASTPTAEPAPPPATAAPTPSADTAAAAPASAPTSGASADAQQPAAAAQPIAVEDHEEQGVQVALMDVRRTSGDTLTVRWQLRNTTDKKLNNSMFYGTRLVDGMYLIDGASKKKYLVVRDADEKPVGYIGQSGDIDPKASISQWAKFPAPPATTTKITVVVPGAAPFEDVAIK